MEPKPLLVWRMNVNVGHTLSQKRPLPHTPFHEHQTKRVCDVETPEAIRVRSADLHSSSQEGHEPH